MYDNVFASPKFNSNLESVKSVWSPFEFKSTVCNRSSVVYNIIDHSPNCNSEIKITGVLDRTAANRRKGVVEYMDLTRVSALKRTEGYERTILTNRDMFKKKTGMFTNMYDVSLRTGGITEPFERRLKERF